MNAVDDRLEALMARDRDQMKEYARLVLLEERIRQELARRRQEQRP